MTSREFRGAWALLLASVAAFYVAAPGLAVLVLVVGAVAVNLLDHRITARRAARIALRERLVEAARAHSASNGGLPRAR